MKGDTVGVVIRFCMLFNDFFLGGCFHVSLLEIVEEQVTPDPSPLSFSPPTPSLSLWANRLGGGNCCTHFANADDTVC